ncbi:MAG: peptidylprolyl isomerase [Oscillospiraceae bacterium]|nr:peptidylprolyl isomerase [Oscillospiraceae bacterium]
MSASTERKNRIAAREAGTDKKTIAAQKEAEKKAKANRRWTIGTIAVLLCILLIILANTNLLYTAPTALTIGGEKYSAAETNYYFGNEYLSFVNNYGSYASMFGLDTSTGISGLDSQENPMGEGTWRDYFLDMAKSDMVQTKALLDYAASEGITLDEETIAKVDESVQGITETAKSYGYSNANQLLAANYGKGVTAKIARQAMLDAELASKAYNAKRDSLTYTEEELEEYYKGLDGESDVFAFSYYYVTAEKEADADGEETVSEEALSAAKAQADAIVSAYKEGTGDASARFAEAVAGEIDGAVSTDRTNVSGSALSSVYKDWVKGSRRTGDIEVFADADENPEGYYVVVYSDRSDNHYPTASVRHILIKAEAGEDGTYSEEAKAAAKARAEEILAEYEAGEKTEKSFAALAEAYSEDGGSNTNGGLYEDIYTGQMVEEFDSFGFEGHQPGDTAIVYGESGSYAGYHVVYFVGEGGLYSSYLAKTDLQNDALTEWSEELFSNYEATEGSGIRFVGK